MRETHRVFVAGTGSFLPGEPIPFDEIERVLGEIDGAPPAVRRWVESTRPVMRELLDIRSVHYAIDPATRQFTEDNVSMGTKAARSALEHGGLAPESVELLCYGSAHQDQMPTASVRIQEALGIDRCAELSIHANCTSSYKALYLAHQLIRAGEYRNALVVSSGISSSELRAEYFNAALVDRESLFLRWFLSDGAGAVVLSSDPRRSKGLEVEFTYIESVGGHRPSLMFNQRPALWLNPKDEYERGLHHLRQRFRNALAEGVFQEAGASVFVRGLGRMLERARIEPSSVRYLQINLPARHVVDWIADECAALGIRRDAVYTRLDRDGYCGPPMPLIALDAMLREEALSPGDRIVSFVTEVSKFMQAGFALRHAPLR